MKKKRQLSKREIQLKELGILKKVVKFMNDNNISYTLCGGTFLGAIRHKGFIPWDDDIDIMMTRPEYEKFIALVKAKGINFVDNLHLHAYELGNLDLPFAKVLDYDVPAREIGYSDKNQQYLWIDVFPIDGLPDDDGEILKLLKKNKRLSKLLSIKKAKMSSLLSKKTTKGIMKSLLKLAILPVPKRRLVHNIIKNSKKYDYGKSKFAGRSAWGYGIREKMEREKFEKLSRTQFEDVQLNILSDYDLYLSNIYGKYMDLPPESKRITHGVEAWTIDDEKNKK